MDESELARFERRVAKPMLFLSAILVLTLIIPLILPIGHEGDDVIDIVGWACWVGFFVEYFVRLRLAPDKRKFVRSNVVDLVILLLPLLRPLRLAQAARTMRLLQAGRIVAVGIRSRKISHSVVSGQAIFATAIVCLTMIVACAALEFDAEHLSAAANIRTVGDAFWWAATTVTSVGYGDRYPVTTLGRMVAVVLMLVGVSITGLIAAALASIFIERKQERDLQPYLEHIIDHLAHIDDRLAHLQSRSESDVSGNI